jgi:hypothetical protein
VRTETPDRPTFTLISLKPEDDRIAAAVSILEEAEEEK